MAAGGSSGNINFLRAMGNSVIFTTIIVVGQTFFCAMAAYAFARLKFIGREFIFYLLLPVRADGPRRGAVHSELYSDSQSGLAEHLRWAWSPPSFPDVAFCGLFPATVLS